MAYTLSTMVKGIGIGNEIKHAIRVTADGAEANISAGQTGMSVVHYVEFAPQSCPTNPIISINENSSGTAANGGIGISGTTSGNEFFLIVYGH